jgi:hypothetical protein
VTPSCARAPSKESNQPASVSEQAVPGGDLATPSLLPLIEWGRLELATAGFEAVHMVFQGGDVCF